MTRRNIIEIFLTLFIFCSSQELSANKDEDLIHLQADSIQYNFKQGIIYYTGHVHAIRHLTDLYADTMTVFYRQRKIQKIVAEGHPAYFSSRPGKEKELLQAYASKIIYYPKTAQVELIDKVIVRQRANQFSGPKLFYDMKKQRVISIASQKSKAQLVIEPYDKLDQHKP